jgi:hypothetical protein
MTLFRNSAHKRTPGNCWAWNSNTDFRKFCISCFFQAHYIPSLNAAHLSQHYVHVQVVKLLVAYFSHCPSLQSSHLYKVWRTIKSVYSFIQFIGSRWSFPKILSCMSGCKTRKCFRTIFIVWSCGLGHNLREIFAWVRRWQLISKYVQLLCIIN